MFSYSSLQDLNYLVLTMKSIMANHIGLLMELEIFLRLVQQFLCMYVRSIINFVYFTLADKHYLMIFTVLDNYIFVCSDQ